MSRTTIYIIFFIVIIILLSIIEPSIKLGLLISIMITLFNYLETILHELGHFIVGKLLGYEIEKVVIGDRKQILGLKLFGTSFIFCYGFGGLTVVKRFIKNNKLRLSAFALGGVMLQGFVISIVYILFGIGSEESYFLPLVFMVMNLKTIVVNLYPRVLYENGKEYPSDGLFLRMILKAKK